MSDYENNKTHNGIYYSRYIASWIRVTEDPMICKGDLRDCQKFIDWLHSQNLTDDEIDDIRFLASNGKYELEQSIRCFLEDKH